MGVDARKDVYKGDKLVAENTQIDFRFIKYYNFMQKSFQVQFGALVREGHRIIRFVARLL